MTYFLADPHYSHDKEFIWKERGFNNIEEHDSCILENCKKLKANDFLYIIGDVSCGRNSLENALKFLNQLICKVFVIKGNHDGSLFKNKDKVNANIKFIDSVCLDIDIGFQSITLCHYPMISWNRSHYNSLNLYGHVHNKKIPIDGKMLDVCPKKDHMYPYSYDEIIDIMESKPNNWDYIEKMKNI